MKNNEQLRECINSGQVSAAQVVAHAGAGELTPMVHQCCGREVCDGTDCPNKGPWYKVPKWRMSGYYYDFEATGSAAIDRILSAVGCAGKCFHHTESWREDVELNSYKHLRGKSPVEWIQNAAIDASEALAAERAEVARLKKALDIAERYVALQNAPWSHTVQSDDLKEVRAALNPTQGATNHD